MVKCRYLSKHISDASWNTLIKMLQYKAVISGAILVKVNPRGTSKTCSECGNKVDMPLHKRRFMCLECGFVCHRDYNASLNILNNGRAGQVQTYKPVEDHVRPLSKAKVYESGTIR